LDLPIELLTVHIFPYLNVKCLYNLKCTCHGLYGIVYEFAQMKYKSEIPCLVNIDEDISDLVFEMESDVELIDPISFPKKPEEHKKSLSNITMNLVEPNTNKPRKPRKK
jgi:hypothetical protein